MLIVALFSFGMKAEAHSHSSIHTKTEASHIDKNVAKDTQSKSESKTSLQPECNHLFMFPSCSFYIRPLIFEQPEATTLKANYQFAVTYSPFRPPLA
jgi:hypothetical protein